MVDKCDIGIIGLAVMVQNLKKKSLSMLSIILLLSLSCGKNLSSANDASAHSPSRIISFAPSITEMLYDLGQGDNIVGVTQFCDFPPEAAKKDKIGGYADRNYEMILRLKPDLAIILKEQRDLTPFFDKYRINHIAVGSDSVEEILESIQKIAAACAINEKGDTLIRHLRSRMENTLDSVNISRPTVLLCVDRDNIGGGAVSKIYAAGSSSFYNRLIEMAGGVNALKDVTRAYPSIGAEAVIRLNPDIIIDISSANGKKNPELSVCDDWKALKNISAVNKGNIHCLKGAHLTRPGPRFVLILDDFIMCLRMREDI